MIYLACTGAVLATGLGAAPSAGLPTVHRVEPGESIQAAVDAAMPGDTIVLSPGTYRESVRITKSDLTLRGSGAAASVLVPGAASAGTCATSGHGVCVTGAAGSPVAGATVRSLTLKGFAKNGLWASRTDRLTVRNVTAENNGQWGVALERSVRSALSHNIARNNGDAGLFVANTNDHGEEGALDTNGTAVHHNLLVGNRIGITVRRLRNVSVGHNEATGNCAAVFLVGDETPPRAGALSVHHNYIHANNKYCPKNPRLPFLQGSGIVLTGVEKSLVTKNLVQDNVGASPLSGGIVLFKSFVAAFNESNDIRDNVLLRNGPADLANRDDAAKDNTFQRNTCAVSEPAGMC
jgi:parallel beta-helix repeat protein